MVKMLFMRVSIARMLRLAALCLALMCVTYPSPVAAQSIGIAASVDIKRFSGEPGSGVLDTEAAGMMLTADLPVATRAAVAVELGLERASTITRVTDVQQGRLQTHYMNQMRTVSVLGAVHPFSSRRVRASVLGGLTFVHFRRTIELQPPAVVSGTPIQPPESVFIDLVAAATVGGEVNVFIAEHVAITGGVRAHAMRLASELGGFSVRPSFGGKWIF